MSTRREYAEKKYLDHLFKQHQQGVLDKRGIALLTEKGYITERGIKYKEEGVTIEPKRSKIISTQDWLDMMNPFSRKKVYQLMRPITKSQWEPESRIDHTKEFVHWIDSMLYGAFSGKAFYKKFDLYKAQAWQWLQDTDTYLSYKTDEERREFVLREYDRCNENTLYFANKYGELKEGDAELGFIDYDAREHHAVIFYICDCGYNFLGGKGRQIGFTSAMGLFATKKLLFSYNYFIKFISEDEDTSEEIFGDKIKYPFSVLPSWMKPPVRSDRGTRLELSDKKKKGDQGYPNSRIVSQPPRKTGINGGSPQLVLMDEIGNIGILSEMLNEGRPTMFWNNPVTGEFEMKRQVIGWSCVCAGTKVFTNDGRIINVEDLQQEDGLVGYNGAGAVPGDIKWMKPPAEKPCYRIETSSGNYIECSADHPMMWSSRLYRQYKDGRDNRKQVTFKKAEDVKVGDQLVKVTEVPIFGKDRVKDARLLGLLIGDGSYGNRYTPNLSSGDKEIEDYVVSNYDSYVRTSKGLTGNPFRNTCIRGIRPILRRCGMLGQTKGNKRLPSNIGKFDEYSIRELLAGYYDADGNVYHNVKKDQTRIVLTSAYVELLDQVKYQLQKLGIYSNIQKEIRRGEKISPGQKDYVYRLYINRHKDVLKFSEKITLLCKHKQDALDKALLSTAAGNARTNDKADFQLNRYLPEKGEYFIGMDDMSHLMYETVTKVEYIGEKTIYNVNVSDTHTYLANGFITSNTGGAMDKSKGAYEREWGRITSLWEARRFKQSGFIPLFFSWHARFSKDEYEREKEWYYGARAAEEDMDLETSKTQFHQHYPSAPVDMFMRSDNTLVKRDIIYGGIDRCKNLSVDNAPVYGFFEPVYDFNDPMHPESDTPYRVIDAKFVPLTDDDDPRIATTIMFQHPQPGWKHRYWQGTDPIATETGHSKMASAIWDDYRKTISCLVNFRKSHAHKEVFLQCMLMGLYFDTQPVKKGVKELVEANIGTNYTDYKRDKGFADTLVFNAELPSKLMGGTREVGIDNKGNRANAIIDYMTELFRAFHNRIFLKVIFDQLSTFVNKITASGKETWEAQNKLLHYDDALYAATFAYICKLCYPNRNPIKQEAEHMRTSVRHELVRMPDGSLVRQRVKKLVKETRVMDDIPEVWK